MSVAIFVHDIYTEILIPYYGNDNYIKQYLH